MTTQVKIQNISTSFYSDGTPNKHGIEVNGQYIGPGEIAVCYVYPGKELVVKEVNRKVVANEVPDDGYDWRPSDV